MFHFPQNIYTGNFMHVHTANPPSVRWVMVNMAHISRRMPYYFSATSTIASYDSSSTLSKPKHIITQSPQLIVTITHFLQTLYSPPKSYVHFPLPHPRHVQTNLDSLTTLSDPHKPRSSQSYNIPNQLHTSIFLKFKYFYQPSVHKHLNLYLHLTETLW